MSEAYAFLLSFMSSAMLLEGALSPDPVAAWIQIALTAISLVLSIIGGIIRWYKKAKEDGKITIDEIQDIVDETKDKIDGHVKK